MGSNRSRKKSCFLWTRKKRKRSIERSGVQKRKKYRCMRCGERQQVHEDARKHAQGQNTCQKNGKYEEGVNWEVMTWSEERTDKGKC